MAASPNLLDEILNGARARDSDFEVVGIFPNSQARPLRPTVYVLSASSIANNRRYKLSGNGKVEYFKCLIFAEGTMSEHNVDQATYSTFVAFAETQHLIHKARALKKEDREGLQAYIREIHQKMAIISNQSILAKLADVKQKAEQMLLVQYETQKAQFNGELGFRNSEDEASGFLGVFSSPKVYDAKPIEEETFIAMLACIIDISEAMQTIAKDKESFLTCREEIVHNLLAGIRDKIYDNRKDTITLGFFYMNGILDKFNTTQESIARDILLNMVLRISEYLIQDLRELQDRANVADQEELSAELQNCVVAFFTLLQENGDNIPEPIKKKLTTHKEIVNQMFMAMHNQKVARENPDVWRNVFPLHAMLENVNVSFEEIQDYVLQQRRSVDIETTDLQGKSILELLRKRNDPRIIKIFIGNCQDQEQRKKLTSCLRPLLEDSRMVLRQEKPSIKGCIDILKLLRKEVDSQKEALAKLDAIEKVLIQMDGQRFEEKELADFVNALYATLLGIYKNFESGRIDVLYDQIFRVDLLQLLTSSQEAIRLHLEDIARKCREMEEKILAEEHQQKKYRGRIEDFSHRIRENYATIRRINQDELADLGVIEKKAKGYVQKILIAGVQAVFIGWNAQELPTVSSSIQNINQPAVLSEQDLIDWVDAEIAQLQAGIDQEMMQCRQRIESYTGPIDNDAQKLALRQFIEGFRTLISELYAHDSNLTPIFANLQFQNMLRIIQDLEKFLSAERPLNSMAVRNSIDTLNASLDSLLAKPELQISAEAREKIIDYKTLIQEFETERFLGDTDPNLRAGFMQAIEGFYALSSLDNAMLFNEEKFAPVLAAVKGCQAILDQNDHDDRDFGVALEMAKVQLATELDKFLMDESISITAEQRIRLAQYKEQLNVILDECGRGIVLDSDSDRTLSNNDIAQLNFERGKLRRLQGYSHSLNSVRQTLHDSVQSELKMFTTAALRLKNETDPSRTEVYESIRRSKSGISEIESRMEGLAYAIRGLQKKLERLHTAENRLIEKQHRLAKLVCQFPFKLFLVERVEDVYFQSAAEIRGNAVFLDNHNRAAIMIDGQCLQEEDGKFKTVEVKADLRGNIPRVYTVESEGTIHHCDDYIEVSAVIEEVLKSEDYSLLYDVSRERAMYIAAAEERMSRERQEEKQRMVADKERASRERGESYSARRELELRKEETEKAALAKREAEEHARRQLLVKVEEERREAQRKMDLEIERGRLRQENMLTVCKKGVERMAQARNEAISSIRAEAEEASRKDAADAFGIEESRLFTIDAVLAATETRTPQQEFDRLQARLKILQTQRDSDFSYHHRYMVATSPDYQKIMAQRIQLCTRLMTAMNRLLDVVDQENVEYPYRKKLKTELETVFSELQALADRDDFFSPDFLVHIDKLSQTIFDFMRIANVADMRIIRNMVCELLPLLFSPTGLSWTEEGVQSQISTVREGRTMKDFRRQDLERSQKDRSVREIDKDIESTQKNLERIRGEWVMAPTVDQLIPLPQEEPVAIIPLEVAPPVAQVVPPPVLSQQETAAERRDREMAERKQAVDARIGGLNQQIIDENKNFTRFSHELAKAQKRRKEWFIDKINTILINLESSHHRMRAHGISIPGAELRICKELERIKRNLEAQEITAGQEGSAYFKFLHEVKEELIGYGKKLYDIRSSFLESLSDSDKRLFGYFEEFETKVADKNREGKGNSIRNLYSFETLQQERDKQQGSAQKVRELRSELKKAEVERDELIKLQERPIPQAISASQPRVSSLGSGGSFFSRFRSRNSESHSDKKKDNAKKGPGQS